MSEVQKYEPTPEDITSAEGMETIGQKYADQARAAYLESLERAELKRPERLEVTHFTRDVMEGAKPRQNHWGEEQPVFPKYVHFTRVSMTIGGHNLDITVPDNENYEDASTGEIDSIKLYPHDAVRAWKKIKDAVSAWERYQNNLAELEKNLPYQYETERVNAALKEALGV